MMTDEKVMSLSQLAAGEDDDNRLEQKRRFGDPVVYGQTIQLLHAFTQKYVRVSSTTTSKREARYARVRDGRWEMDIVVGIQSTHTH